MKQNDLIELQGYSFDIIKAVDKFCKDNKIKYFLSEGTLLGAVRHQGFIPWDDDVDIMMLREDFNRFITLFKKNPPNGFILEYFNTLENYWLPFAKIKMTKKTKFIIKTDHNLSDNTGPRIDIFPLDYVPNINADSRERINKKIKIFKRILYYKAFKVHNRSLKSHILGFLARILPQKYLVDNLNKYMTLYNKGNRGGVVNYGSSYSVKKETFPITMFKKTKLVKFNDYMLPISPNYDEILSQIYGNYHELPPLEKRESNHNIIIDKDFRL